LGSEITKEEVLINRTLLIYPTNAHQHKHGKSFAYLVFLGRKTRNGINPIYCCSAKRAMVYKAAVGSAYAD
jgi:hypothetical protein